MSLLKREKHLILAAAVLVSAAFILPAISAASPSSDIASTSMPESVDRIVVTPTIERYEDYVSWTYSVPTTIPESSFMIFPCSAPNITGNPSIDHVWISYTFYGANTNGLYLDLQNDDGDAWTIREGGASGGGPELIRNQYQYGVFNGNVNQWWYFRAWDNYHDNVVNELQSFELRVFYEVNDTFPPTPATMAFNEVPHALSTSSIAMEAIDADDPSGVIYYFDETTGQSGGSDSGWQSSRSYMDSGLAPNTRYGYRTQAGDESSNFNVNNFSTISYAYTLQNTPTVALSSHSETSISLAVTNSPNISLASSGIRWHTDSGYGATDRDWWSVLTLSQSGLEPGRLYRWQAQARNGDAIETSWSSWFDAYTLPATPYGPTVTAAGEDAVYVTPNRGTNADVVELGIWCGTTDLWVQPDGSMSSTSAWQTQAAWGSVTVSGLEAETEYCFVVMARNENGDESGWSTNGCATTSPPQYPDLVVSEWAPNSEIQIFPGDVVAFTYRIKNVGTDAAPTFYAGVYQLWYTPTPDITDPVGVRVQSVPVTSLAIEQETTQILFDVPFTDPGDYWIYAFADINHSVTESENGNNASFHSFSPGYTHVIVGHPDEWDLEASSATISDTTPDPGQTVEFSFDVANHSINNGTAIPTPMVIFNEIRWSQDNDLLNDYVVLGWANTPTLAADGTWSSGPVSVEVPVSAPVGQTSYMGVVVDSAPLLDEFDETNNVSYVPIVPQGRGSVTGHVSLATEPGGCLGGVKIRLEIGGTIQETYTDNTGYYEFIDVEQATGYTIQPIDSEYVLVGDWIWTPTYETIAVTHDNETVVDFSAVCVGAPEIAIEGLPGSFDPGDPFTFTVRLQNIGTGVDLASAYLSVTVPQDVTVAVQCYTSGIDQPIIYERTAEIQHAPESDNPCGYPMFASHILVDEITSQLGADEEIWMTLEVMPDPLADDSINILVNGSIGDKHAPTSGDVNQQGWRVETHTVQCSQTYTWVTMEDDNYSYSAEIDATSAITADQLLLRELWEAAVESVRLYSTDLATDETIQMTDGGEIEHVLSTMAKKAVATTGASFADFGYVNVYPQPGEDSWVDDVGYEYSIASPIELGGWDQFKLRNIFHLLDTDNYGLDSFSQRSKYYQGAINGLIFSISEEQYEQHAIEYHDIYLALGDILIETVPGGKSAFAKKFKSVVDDFSKYKDIIEDVYDVVDAVQSDIALSRIMYFHNFVEAGGRLEALKIHVQEVQMTDPSAVDPALLAALTYCEARLNENLFDGTHLSTAFEDQMQSIDVLFDFVVPGSSAGLMGIATEAILDTLPGWIKAPISAYDELLDAYEVFNYGVATCTLYHLIGQFTMTDEFFVGYPDWERAELTSTLVRDKAALWYQVTQYNVDYLDSWIVQVGNWAHGGVEDEIRDFWLAEYHKSYNYLKLFQDPWQIAGIESYETNTDHRWLFGKVTVEGVHVPVIAPAAVLMPDEVLPGEAFSIQAAEVYDNLGYAVEYQFSVDGAEQGWGGAAIDWQAPSAGSVTAQVQARSVGFPAEPSAYSPTSTTSVISEDVVSVPSLDLPNGFIYDIGEDIVFQVGSSTSQFGDPVEYTVAITDGTTLLWRADGFWTTQLYIPGNYLVYAKARNANRPEFVSNWTEPVTLTIEDANPLEFQFSSEIVNVAEGEVATTQVRLNRDPYMPVSVEISFYSGDPGVQVTDGAQLTFGSTDFDTFQPIAFTASIDDDAFDNQALFEVAATGSQAIPSGYITVNVNDPQELQYLVDLAEPVGIPEGGQRDITVTLSANPVNPIDVGLTLLSGGDADLGLLQTQITINNSNWQSGVPFTVTAAEDDGDMDAGTAQVQLAAVPGLELPERSVNLIEQDNDVPVNTVIVNVVPDELQVAWHLDGPESYEYDGIDDAILEGLATGDYTLTWPAIAGWQVPSPNPDTRVLQEQQSVTFTGDYQVLPAVITQLTDIPDDQGRWLHLEFTRCGYDMDNNGWPDTPVVGYNIHRLVAEAALAAAVTENGFPLEPGRVTVDLGGRQQEVYIPVATDLRTVRYDDRLFVVSTSRAAPAGTWEVVGAVFATLADQYACVVPTISDGTPATYSISAHTTDPATWFWDDATMSGTSIDNILPEPPSVFALTWLGGGNRARLEWSPSEAEDVVCYNIYRDDEIGFEPNTSNLVHVAYGLSWVDDSVTAGDVHYKLTAVDDGGNESEAVEPAATTSTGPLALTTACRLHAAYPNPFNPMTTIPFEIRDTGLARLCVYGLDGKRIVALVDGIVAPGRHEAIWQGTNDRGERVASGTYFYRIEAGGYSETRRMTLVK